MSYINYSLTKNKVLNVLRLSCQINTSLEVKFFLSGQADIIFYEIRLWVQSYRGSSEGFPKWELRTWNPKKTWLSVKIRFAVS